MTKYRRRSFLLLIMLVMVLTMAVPVWAEDAVTQPSGTVTEQNGGDGSSGSEDGSGGDPAGDPDGAADPADAGTTVDAGTTGAAATTSAAATTKAAATKVAATAATKAKVLRGWQKIDGEKYYYKNGKPLTGIHKIDGKVYSFTKSGKLNTKASGKMDVKAYAYSSRTGYLILVNCATHRVGIYEGKKHQWTRTHYWKCGDGKKSTPTVKGTFKTGSYLGRAYKQRYFDSYGSRCWYATRIYNGYLFHSVLYKPASKPKKIRDGRLGKGVSHGCVRLALKNAKWIYKHIPKKTKVVIY